MGETLFLENDSKQCLHLCLWHRIGAWLIVTVIGDSIVVTERSNFPFPQ